MDLQLTGRTGLVTGASSGIGRAIALELGRAGVRMVVTARRRGRLEEVAAEIVGAGGPPPVVLAQDLLAEDAAGHVVQVCGDELGTTDIVVDNAGGYGDHAHGLGVEDDDLERGFLLNFTRHRQITHGLMPGMIDAGWGRVLVVSAGGSPAKAALTRWANRLAQDVARHGVTVNTIAPGLITTEKIVAKFPAEVRERQAREQIPYGAYGEPEDLAYLAAFLCSPQARYITGGVINVDGGYRTKASTT